MIKFCFTQAIILILVLSFGGSNKYDENLSSSDSAIQVMLLGVYHFDNPGLDKHNLEVDDYFTDKRQNEISELVNLLSGFEPNRIFVEQFPSLQNKTDSLYNAFINNELTLNEIERGRNEIFQIGFNLGKKLNVRKIDCIDSDGTWLGTYADFIADTLSFSEYQHKVEKSKSDLAEMNEKFKNQTIRENLVFMNQKEIILDRHNYYIDAAMRVKDTVGIHFKNQDTTLILDEKEYFLRSFDFENVGVELVAEWYKRNFFIYRNILEKSNKGDKILIIFGRGHLPILQHLLESNLKYKVISPLDYL